MSVLGSRPDEKIFNADLLKEPPKLQITGAFLDTLSSFGFLSTFRQRSYNGIKLSSAACSVTGQKS